MSSRTVNSAIFGQASGPHGPLIPLPPWEPGFYGLGEAGIAPEGQDLDWLGADGVWGGDAILAPGQAQKFQVAWQTRRPIAFEDIEALRGRVEGRVEAGGVWTKCLKLSPEALPLTEGLWIWTAGPVNGPIASSEIARRLRDAARAELPLGEGNVTVLPLASPALATGFTSTPWPPVGLGIVGPDWAGKRGLRRPRAQRGLGDGVFDQLARGFTNVSVDTLCSPAFQAVAAQGVSRRYGEEQARAFREAFRNATRFCDPDAQARFEAQRQAEERRQGIYVGGAVALAAAAIFAVWYFGRDKRARNRRRRRNRAVRRRNAASVSVSDRGRKQVHVWDGGSSVDIYDVRSGRLAGRYEVLPWMVQPPSASQVRDRLKRICRRR